MLRSFTQFSRSMRKMAREFTDGMNQIANDAEVTELKKAMNEAKDGDLDKLASVIDPGGDVSESVRDLKDSMDKDAAAEDIRKSAIWQERPARILPMTRNRTNPQASPILMLAPTPV